MPLPWHSTHNVPDKRCANGHFIDESWDLCPYCPADRKESIPVVRPRNPSSEPAVSLDAEKKAGDPLKFPEPVVRADRNSPKRSSAAPPASRPERTVTVARIDGAAPIADNAPRYVVGWLIGLSGSIKGESFAIRAGRNILGRDRKSDVYVNDDQASSHHADLVFRSDEQRFILMDHNSTNGTYVNEREIEPRKDLTTKDVIRIGTHRYLFFPLCGEDWSWESQESR